MYYFPALRRKKNNPSFKDEIPI
uniref:Uncharacterized protein n=1 Tax=Anguilla anguilla TaxID=7936 RepID=A0A0E9XW92_ANGAN